VDLLAALLREKFGHNTSLATLHEMLGKGHLSEEALSDVIISNFMDEIHIAVEISCINRSHVAI
jgi:hypothetical protein